MLEAVVSGVLQGITEWLPISSEGVLVLVKTRIFHSPQGLPHLMEQALFLHLGTFLAALIYFRKDVISLLKAFFRFNKAKKDQETVLTFLIIATLMSGFLGLLLFKLLERASSSFALAGKGIIVLISCLLLINAFLQIKAGRKRGEKKESALTTRDGFLLGFLQGMAVLPGLSRSGLTVSGLLLNKFDSASALRVSFLMSLPIVFFGNLFLNLTDFVFTFNALLALFLSFLFGILTIGFLLRLAKKVNFGWFVLSFAALSFLSLLF